MFDRRFLRIYIVPGAVFQSVMIGGGYGTGREIVEYFTSYGPVGGLLGLGVSFAALALILALTFELARTFQVFDYRNFFKLLLGRGWVAFELLIILQFLLVLAVLASASGSILTDNFGAPYLLGLALMLCAVGVLIFYGREVIVRVLTLWSAFLYVVLIAFFLKAVSTSGTAVVQSFETSVSLPGWWLSGLKYALYNLSAVPLLLYVARPFRARREAVGSGIIAALIAIVPALLFHVVFAGTYPAVLDQAIPVYWIMAQLGASFLLVVYSVMLFGTFIETGAGMLQGINERFDAWLTEVRGTGMSRRGHASLAIGSILLSAALSFFGIIELIARGYGTMAWGFLFVYGIPLVTFGVFRILSRSPQRSDAVADPRSR